MIPDVVFKVSYLNADGCSSELRGFLIEPSDPPPMGLTCLISECCTVFGGVGGTEEVETRTVGCSQAPYPVKASSHRDALSALEWRRAGILFE